MSARTSLATRIDDYIAERHRLGFELHSRDTLLAGFARYVASQHHRGPLTVELMANWARQDKWHRGTPGTWAARLARLRHFARYLKQLEPDTEVPDELIFGPEPGRVAPHIYHEEEIVELLAAASQLGPRGSLRPATFATLFGLMASTGLRVSEAIHLRDADVDLKRGMLTIRQTKFAKLLAHVKFVLRKGQRLAWWLNIYAIYLKRTKNRKWNMFVIKSYYVNGASEFANHIKLVVIAHHGGGQFCR